MTHPFIDDGAWGSRSPEFFANLSRIKSEGKDFESRFQKIMIKNQQLSIETEESRGKVLSKFNDLLSNYQSTMYQKAKKVNGAPPRIRPPVPDFEY